MTCKYDTLLTLRDKGSATRAELQKELQYTESALKKALADLTRSWLLLENRGKYTITQKGREMLNTPEHLNTITNVRQLPDLRPAYAKSTVCSFLYDHKSHFTNMDANDLLPFVFVYQLIMRPDLMEKIIWDPKPTDKDETLANTAMAAFNALWSDKDNG